MKARMKPNWHCPSCGKPKLLRPAALAEYLKTKKVCRSCKNRERLADGKYKKEEPRENV